DKRIAAAFVNGNGGDALGELAARRRRAAMRVDRERQDSREGKRGHRRHRHAIIKKPPPPASAGMIRRAATMTPPRPATSALSAHLGLLAPAAPAPSLAQPRPSREGVAPSVSRRARSSHRSSTEQLLRREEREAARHDARLHAQAAWRG